MIFDGKITALAGKMRRKKNSQNTSSKKDNWRLFDLFVPLNQIAENQISKKKT